MKQTTTVVVGVMIFGLGIAYSQQVFTHKPPVPTNNPTPSSGEEWRLQLVEHLLSLPSPLHNGAIQLHGMGDEAAVDILKILGTRDALTTAEQQSCLDIIHMAFEQPASIIIPMNKKPSAARFVLRHLSTIDDPMIKQRLELEMTFLEAAGAQVPR